MCCTTKGCKEDWKEALLQSKITQISLAKQAKQRSLGLLCVSVSVLVQPALVAMVMAMGKHSRCTMLYYPIADWKEDVKKKVTGVHRRCKKHKRSIQAQPCASTMQKPVQPLQPS